MNFRLARDQAVLVETAAICEPARVKQTPDFSAVFPSFELGGITKHLMNGPGLGFASGNIKRLGETKLTVFFLGTVIKCLTVDAWETYKWFIIQERQLDGKTTTRFIVA